MSLYLDDGDVTLLHGDAATVLADLPEGSVDCCVTSPPYFGLRDYGYPGQIGLEPTPEEYVAALVAVFREVRRVLAPWGTCWVNIGDSYANTGLKEGNPASSGLKRDGRSESSRQRTILGSPSAMARTSQPVKAIPAGVKPKDLLMMPARLALALQADGWWVRSRIVWSKPNPMPESVTDRPTSAHEDVYLLTKAPRYYYDAEAVREPAQNRGDADVSLLERKVRDVPRNGGIGRFTRGGGSATGFGSHAGRNLRNVWSIATEPTPEAHFATFPLELVRRCLAAGCPERVCRECGEPSRRIVETVGAEKNGRAVFTGQRIGHDAAALAGSRIQPAQRGHDGTPITQTTGWTDCGHDAWRPGIVLDPFIGSGKTAQQARRMGLHAVGIDASAEYLAIAAKRLQQLSLLGGVA